MLFVPRKRNLLSYLFMPSLIPHFFHWKCYKNDLVLFNVMLLNGFLGFSLRSVFYFYCCLIK